MFQVQHGAALYTYIAGAAVVSVILFFALTLVPTKLRRPLIMAVTFAAGLFYALEFFWPVSGPESDQKNFLTAYIKPFSDITTVLQSFALGLGVYSLVSIHMRKVARTQTGWAYSLVLIVSMIVMVIAHIGKEYIKSPWVHQLNEFAYSGLMKSLDATMFSIIAFYIVSAAYRAFRIRSTEATILLVSAGIIMLGQVAIGQAITNAIPNEGLTANFRVENMANWILKKVNSPAIMAIDFGLGVGGLATALRLWLSLERGSYFEEEL